jgi:hypothetical protein
LSATDRWGKSSGSWKIIPMPRRWMGRSVTSTPSTRTRPAASGTTPAIVASRVDFPLPLGPRIATISAGARTRSMPVANVTPS